jgi:hypothetical protein
VPSDYNGMGLLVAIGGGATPSSVASISTGKGGGGSGGTAYKFINPINNTFAPLAIGQTVYVSPGAYAAAPVANTVGANGTSSWANVIANSSPSSISQGPLALGGSTTTTNSGGAGGLVTYADISVVGKAGGSINQAFGQPSFTGAGGASTLFAGGSLLSGSTFNSGGTGGGGTTSAGVASESVAGNGSAGGNGSVSGGAGGLGGSSSTAATAGTAGSPSTGAGGGGGGTYITTGSGTIVSSTSAVRSAGSTTLTITQASHGMVSGAKILMSSTTYNKTGTYSRSATTVTVSITSHGLLLGDLFYFDATSGTQVDGTFTVTAVVNANQFRFTSATSGTTSGTCQLGFSALGNSVYYTITYIDASTFSVVSTSNTILSAGQVTLNYYRTNLSAISGANGGDGATNSSQFFIRYYNGVYTPGYFGVGAGGGGAGGTLSTNGVSGNGGAGGIGAGGGGIARQTSTNPASTATSGRGGPGMVMFIYALRANNQSAIQGM